MKAVEGSGLGGALLRPEVESLIPNAFEPVEGLVPVCFHAVV